MALNDLLDLMAEPAAMLAANGLVMSVNHLFAERFASCLGGAFSDLIAPADRGPFQALTLAIAMGAQKRRHLDLQIALADGGTCWHRLSFAAMAGNAEGHEASVIVQCTDISDLMNQAAAMARSERNLRMILAGADTGVWDVDLIAGETWYSETWRAMRGYGPMDPVPMSLADMLDCIHPDDRAKVQDRIMELLHGGAERVTYDYRVRHGDGHYIWVECRGASVDWCAGRPSRIVGTEADITTRKLAEAEFAVMSRRVQLALEVSGLGVFEADFDRQVTHWDDRLRSIYGVDGVADIRIGKVWEERLHPDDRHRVLRTIQEKVMALEPWIEEYRIRRPDGGERFIHARALPYLDEDGYRKLVGVNRDITEDVLLRKDLERARELAESRNRDLEAAKAEIERIAMLDPLTSLPNRRGLDVWLKSHGRAADSPPGGLAMLHIDLDHFKSVNDTWGHEAGDRVLQHAAEALRRSALEGDTVARLGGDEFLLVTPFHGDLGAIEERADALVRAIRRPVPVGGALCVVGASIGVAATLNAQCEPGQILRQADLALYRVKQSGRNGFAIYDPAIDR